MDMTEKKAVWPGWETVRLIGRGSFGAVYEIEREVFGHRERAAMNGKWEEFAGADGFTSLGIPDGAVNLPTATWSLQNWSVSAYEATLRDVAAGKLVIDDNFDNLASTAHVALNVVE